VACNFLDEQNGSKTDFNNDLYKSIDSDGYNVSYICMSCRPFFLKSVKIEHDYRKAQTTFEEKQESVINHSSLSDCATKPNHLKKWIIPFPHHLLILTYMYQGEKYMNCP